MEFNTENIVELDKLFRINLINSITGAKPANLIATRSKNGKDNVAIFSSVVHLGSNPAMIGFVMRPQIDKNTDTYQNILETKSFTINHITEDIYIEAHKTSIKTDISEFELFDLHKEERAFKVPFVKGSPVQIGLNLLKMIDLPNGCIFIIGSVEYIYTEDEIINDEGKLNLEKGNSVALSGLDGYYGLKFLKSIKHVKTFKAIND